MVKGFIFVFLALLGLSFVVKNKQDSCRNLASISYNERQACWYNEMKMIIQRQGLDAAFERLAELFQVEPTFASGCHDVTHLIGDAAYQEFAKGKHFKFNDNTSYCGYGFYHGFIEALLSDKNDLKGAREFCEGLDLAGDIKSPNAVYSCYHGMGHSTFDWHDPTRYGSEEKMLDPAISLCEKVTEGLESEKTKQCVTGVFNALGIAYSNDQFELKLNEADPVWVCRKYQGVYKKACFAEVPVAWVYTKMGGGDYEFAKAANFIQGLEDREGEETAIFTLTADYVRQKRDKLNNEEMKNLCRSLKSFLQPFCLEGVVESLMGLSTPGEEHLAVLNFCEGLNNEEKSTCLGYFLPRVGTLYSEEKTAAVCATVEEGYRHLCQ